MGRIGFVLTWIKRRAKMDYGGGDVRIADHFGSPGEDCQPLPGEFGAAVELVQTGKTAVVGYLDQENESKALPGERRVYARNDDGEIVCTMWMHNDGVVDITNNNGSFQMTANGDVNINGVTIDTNGNISTIGSLSAVGVTDSTTSVTLGTHIHAGIGTPPTPGT